MKRKHTIIIISKGFNFTVREPILVPTQRFNLAKRSVCWLITAPLYTLTPKRVNSSREAARMSCVLKVSHTSDF